MKTTVCDKCGAAAKKHFRIEVMEAEDFDSVGPGLKFPAEFHRARPVELNHCRPTLELCESCWGYIQQGIEEARKIR